jgi:hypothetical protein
MITTTQWRAAGFKSQAIAYALLNLCLLETAEGNLTEGGTVTADSVFIDAAAPSVSDCISHLVDGVFSPLGFSKATHCIAHNNSEATGQDGWMNIDMGSKTVV